MFVCVVCAGRAAQCARASTAADEGSRAVEACITRMNERCAQSEVLLAHLIAGVRSALVETASDWRVGAAAAAVSLCRDRQKQCDDYVEELDVRIEQLEAAARLCASAE